MNKSFCKLSKQYCIADVLWALVPYTQENLDLTFRPNKFFKELAYKQSQQRNSLERAYYRALQKGLIEFDEDHIPKLTPKGRAALELYHPQYFKGAGRLLLVFDIPEEQAWKRRRLRRVLKELRFKQVQKSVWMTRYDCRNYLKAEIKTYQLKEYVHLFEVTSLDHTI